MVLDKASEGKQWWLATTDDGKRGGQRHRMVVDSGGPFGCRWKMMADRVGGGKWWWLAMTNGAGGSGRQWQTGLAMWPLTTINGGR